MVKIMENLIKLDDLGGNPLFSETFIYPPGKTMVGSRFISYSNSLFLGDMRSFFRGVMFGTHVFFSNP